MAQVLFVVVLMVDVRIGLAALRARSRGRNVTWVLPTLAGSFFGGVLLSVLLGGRALAATASVEPWERAQVMSLGLSWVFWGVGVAVLGALVAAVGMMAARAAPGPDPR